jgi:hypothetical protein
MTAWGLGVVCLRGEGSCPFARSTFGFCSLQHAGKQAKRKTFDFRELARLLGPLLVFSLSEIAVTAL